VLANPRQRAHALRRHHRMERRFHRTMGPGMVRPHWRYRRVGGRVVRAPYSAIRRRAPGGVVIGTGYTRPGVVPGTVARRGARPGQIVRGQCFCPPCPACGATVAPASAAVPAPAYCRCCGQLLR
jgi:hypothetical protein